ncbi:MAG TPA: HIT family protein [Kofleriaceae bacterium]|jgi:histidine triad (HIT) family protein
MGGCICATRTAAASRRGTSPDCIFCRIVERSADALLIHEDDRTISFLALEPAISGHTVLAPKAHYADVYTIPEDLLSDLMKSCQSHARRWREQVGASGINILHASGLDADQSVGHCHFHLFPRFARDGIRAWPTLARPAQTREEMHAVFRLDA